MEYEICYLIGESKEANLDNIRPKVEQIIEKHKGTFLEGEFLRKRRLSYEIKGEARGTYVARRFTVPSKDERDELFPDYDIMGEINKELRFNQDIIRFMVVKTDDLPPLKDLELVEEKSKEQNFKREEKFVVKSKNEKVIPAKEDKKEEFKKVKAEEKVKKAEKVASVKEEEVSKVSAELLENKSKSKSAKKDKEILGDDIDEKLDEILNI